MSLSPMSSQSALKAARKDLGDIVVQAYEFTKLASPITATARETSAAGAESSARAAPASETGAELTTENEKAGDVSASTEPGAGELSSKSESANAADSVSSGVTEAGPSDSSTAPEDPSFAATDPAISSSSSTSTLFARLQSALPPNIVAAVQTNITALHIPESLESLKHASETSLESLKHASEARLENLRAAAASAGSSATANASAAAAGIDLAGLRTNLLSELQRVQGLTLAQAEEYAHKSEALLRDAVKEAGEVLREAVKVIPPEEAAGSGSSTGPAAMLWDGTEMWLLPEASASSGNLAASTSTTATKGGLEASANAVKTRAEALLLRLKQDPDIVRHDPEAEEGVRERFLAWKEKEVDSVEGGIDGAEWKAKIKEAVEDIRDGAHLRALEDTLGIYPPITSLISY